MDRRHSAILAFVFLAASVIVAVFFLPGCEVDWSTAQRLAQELRTNRIRYGYDERTHMCFAWKRGDPPQVLGIIACTDEVLAQAKKDEGE